MKNRNIEHSDNWATPQDFLNKLNEEFNFDFDPCPYNTGDLEFDGLEVEWGSRNYINPPYSRTLKEAFVLKALEESRKGKLCVLLLPVSTSTKLFHDVIKPNARDIRFIRGRIPFIGINTKGEYVNWDKWNKEAPPNVIHVKNSGMHDSMIVIL